MLAVSLEVYTPGRAKPMPAAMMPFARGKMPEGYQNITGQIPGGKGGLNAQGKQFLATHKLGDKIPDVKIGKKTYMAILEPHKPYDNSKDGPTEWHTGVSWVEKKS